RKQRGRRKVLCECNVSLVANKACCKFDTCIKFSSDERASKFKPLASSHTYLPLFILFFRRGIASTMDGEVVYFKAVSLRGETFICPITLALHVEGMVKA